MLKILRNFSIDSTNGDHERMLNAFVPSVLIEVVAENYRYLMHESAFPSGDNIVDPPLRANERVLSGLFATAISRVSPRSRPEVRVDRTSEDDSDDDETSAGRVDYLAWYGNQTIAVELKVVQINIDTARITDRLKKRWKSVNSQAESAQRFLAGNKFKYPNATSVGLLVVIGRRTVSSLEMVSRRPRDGGEFSTETNAFNKVLSDALSPAFHATYIVPAEFRAARRKRRGEDAKGVVYTPVITFLSNHFKGK